MERPTIPDQGLYLHLPFCTTKCGYCDFYSVPLAEHDARRFIDAALDELGIRTMDNGGSIETLFIGGGTPTVLSPDLLARLLASFKPIAAKPICREFTVEANPATLDRRKVELLANAGVDRVSFGAQSFQEGELAVLDRLHSPEDVPRAVKTVREGGIERLNLDLIFGIPGQSLDSWLASIDRALELRPEHLALYGLTYEPNTPLTRRREAGELTPCDEDLESEMYLAAAERLSAAGLEPYEISNFARPGEQCRHNLAYWHGRSYIGVGPSAVGCDRGQRYRNVADVGEYVRRITAERSAVAETEQVEGLVLARETVMLRLRLAEGLDLAEFRNLTGHDPLAVFGTSIARFASEGLATVTESHLALTMPGRLLADTVIAELMGDLDRTSPLDPA